MGGEGGGAGAAGDSIAHRPSYRVGIVGVGGHIVKTRRRGHRYIPRVPFHRNFHCSVKERAVVGGGGKVDVHRPCIVPGRDKGHLVQAAPGDGGAAGGNSGPLVGGGPVIAVQVALAGGGDLEAYRAHVPPGVPLGQAVEVVPVKDRRLAVSGGVADVPPAAAASGAAGASGGDRDDAAEGLIADGPALKGDIYRAGKAA